MRNGLIGVSQMGKIRMGMGMGMTGSLATDQSPVAREVLERR
jgi:hypothetical protein